ncbi:MAG: FUSC family protein [Chloroflexota bacterium]
MEGLQRAVRPPNDPGLSGLRRAIRAAIVIPASFAFAKLAIGDANFTTFVAFGCFALLILADFGGFRRPRALAYITTTLVGSALVVVGTLASANPWIGALLMFVVGFSIQFVGVFGGYATAAQTALQLSFVLSVSIAAPASAIEPRLSGWLVAGCVCTLAGVFIWPQFERFTLAQRAAEALRTLAGRIAAERHGIASTEVHTCRDAAEQAVTAMRQAYNATPKRPAGPTRRDRAIVELMAELERTRDFLDRPFQQDSSDSRPCIAEGDALASAVVDTLQGSAAVLADGSAPPDIDQLQEMRALHRQALDRWAAEELQSGTAPETVLDGIDIDHALRVVSYLALAMSSNAIIAARGRVDTKLSLPAGTPREGIGRVAIRIVRTIRTHLDPRSSLLHSSLRVGFGLAIAVLFARLLRLDHGFWVVLGTLSVLRSSALGTGRTTIQALVGAIIGFAVGALFTTAVGATSEILWGALVVTVFLAAYASSTVGFVLGQAAFTVNLIILFNLISPVGWKIGLVRIEDVAIGAGISVVAGVLLWPRGARGEFHVALAGLYRAASAFLADSFARILTDDSPSQASRARALVIHARDRAGEAFEQFLTERGSNPLAPEKAGYLLAMGTHAIMAGDAINVVADMGYQADGCHDGKAALQAHGKIVAMTFQHLADRLAGAPKDTYPHVSLDRHDLREAALICLRRWKTDPAAGRAAIAVVSLSEWIDQLNGLAVALEEPVEEAVKAARVPWWR